MSPLRTRSLARGGRLAAVLAIAVLTAACGAEPAADAEQSAQERSATGATRTVEHVLGTAEVPTDPQRIVSVSGTTDLEALLALGVTPVAAAGDDADGGGGFVWLAHMEPYLDGVQMLPSRREIDLEAVATTRPDLIIGLSGQIQEVYDQLSQIAPTYAVDSMGDWREQTREVAALLGEEEAAEQLFADYDARVAALVDEYGEEVEGLTYTQGKSFAAGGADGEFYVYIDDKADEILQPLGMRRPDEQAAAFDSDATQLPISLEQVELVDTDVLFLYYYPGDEEREQLDALRSDPLWSSLDALESNRVFEVRSEWWWLGGALGMDRVLDDLENDILPALTAAVETTS
jgi:iron complex transport system substrate-binding protein